MKLFARIVIVLLAVAEGSVWTYLKTGVWKLGNAFGGSGDGAGVHPSSSEQLFATLVIEGVWLLLISPYICMLLGSLNLIKGKLLRFTYVYSLAVLSVMTLILCLIFQRVTELMALGNLVAGILWAFYFRRE